MAHQSRHAVRKSKRPLLDRIALVGSTVTMSVTLVLAGLNVATQGASSSSEVPTASSVTNTQPKAAADTAPRHVPAVKPHHHKPHVTKAVVQHKSNAQAAHARTKLATRKYLASRSHASHGTASRMRSIVSLKGQIASLKSQLTKPTISGSKVLDLADNYRGVPYVSAGTSPRGFDCSGYTQYVYGKLGISLPRVADAQSQFASRVTRSQAHAGDLVFFHSSNGYVYHVGIYAGNGQFWHSPRPGKSVRLDPLWSGKVYTFGRVGSAHVQHALMNRIIQKTQTLKALAKKK